MKLIMIVRLNPAIIAYRTSEAAIPKPDKNPDFQFLLTVRLIQSIPKGPSGTDTAMPIIKPSQSRLKLIAAKIAEKLILIIQIIKAKLKLATIFSTFILEEVLITPIK